jgi:hypothetical protein
MANIYNQSSVISILNLMVPSKHQSIIQSIDTQAALYTVITFCHYQRVLYFTLEREKGRMLSLRQFPSSVSLLETYLSWMLEVQNESPDREQLLWLSFNHDHHY